jgi:hypothetical protein
MRSSLIAGHPCYTVEPAHKDMLQLLIQLEQLRHSPRQSLFIGKDDSKQGILITRFFLQMPPLFWLNRLSEAYPYRKVRLYLNTGTEKRAKTWRAEGSISYTIFYHCFALCFGYQVDASRTLPHVSTRLLQFVSDANTRMMRTPKNILIQNRLSLPNQNLHI